MPVEVGSVTLRAAAAAIVASAAVPPRESISRPAATANGCEVATIPLRPITGERRESKTKGGMVLRRRQKNTR